MKIWYTEIGEPLPIQNDERLHRCGMMTRFLASRGHDVTWWTSTFVHSKKQHVFEQDVEQTVEGVKLRILRGPGYSRNVSPARFKHQADFARRFTEEAPRAERPDIIISPVPTLEVAEAAVRLGKAWGVPVLTDIRDEWPEEFVDLAPKPLRWAARIALTEYFRKIRYICSNADGILAMSQRQLDYGLKYSDRGAIPQDGVFPLGYSANLPDRVKIDAALKYWRDLGVDGSRFTGCFFGTIGKFFRLETVIQAARRLSSEMNIQFVLCGNGSSLEKYRKLASGLDSVIFPGWVDGPKVAALMEVSDFGLAPYSPGTRMSLPNKPFEYMAGGLPIVSSIQGELTGILAREQCGITYGSNSVDELCAAVRRIHASRQEAEAMGARARTLLDREFTTESIFARLEKHLATIVSRGEARTQNSPILSQ